MTPCPSAVAIGCGLRCKHGAACAVCHGRGVVATSVTREQWADLIAAGWSVDDRGELRHAEYGRARVEAALALMESDKRAAKRAAERMTT